MPEKLILEKDSQRTPSFECAKGFSNISKVSMLRLIGMCAVVYH